MNAYQHSKERKFAALDRIAIGADARAREAASIAEALRLARSFADAASIRHGDNPLTYQLATEVVQAIDGVLPQGAIP